MKKAEEWLIVINENRNHMGNANPLRQPLENIIKQIQLDAYKAGMTEAAEIALKQQTGNSLSLHHYLICEEAILTTRDKKEKI